MGFEVFFVNLLCEFNKYQFFQGTPTSLQIPAWVAYNLCYTCKIKMRSFTLPNYICQRNLIESLIKESILIRSGQNITYRWKYCFSIPLSACADPTKPSDTPPPLHTFSGSAHDPQTIVVITLTEVCFRNTLLILNIKCNLNYL